MATDAASFVVGETIHVTGKDPALLEQSLREATASGGYAIEHVDTGLEDVFIHLTGKALRD